MRASCSIFAGSDCSCPTSAENALIACFSSFIVPQVSTLAEQAGGSPEACQKPGVSYAKGDVMLKLVMR